jgi:hypothetical protein
MKSADISSAELQALQHLLDNAKNAEKSSDK